MVTCAARTSAAERVSLGALTVARTMALAAKVMVIALADQTARMGNLVV